MKYFLCTICLMASFGISAEAARPCKTIVEACLSAGVIQSNASRQTMFENCVKPVVAGRGIMGVNVSPSVIQGCKAKIAAQE
jgi:hypothetical protein